MLNSNVMQQYCWKVNGLEQPKDYSVGVSLQSISEMFTSNPQAIQISPFLATATNTKKINKQTLMGTTPRKIGAAIK